MKKKILVLMAVLLLPAIPAMAAPTALLTVDNLPNAPHNFNFPGGVGFAFTVHEAVWLDGLGVYSGGSDGSGNGLTKTLSATLFDSNGDPILSQNIDNTMTTPGIGESGHGFTFNIQSVPLELAAGDYTVAGYGWNAANPYLFHGNGAPTFDGEDGLVTLGSSVITASRTALADISPTVDVAGIWAGGNLAFSPIVPEPEVIIPEVIVPDDTGSDAVPVPAPGALVLAALGTGLAGFIRRKRTL